MMNWTNIRELARDLSLKSDPDDLEAVKKEIKMRRAEIHPDHNGGQFQSDEQKDEFQRLSDALASVGDQSTQMVPPAQMTTLIKSLVRELAQRPQADAEERGARALSNLEKTVSKRLLIPKVSLGVITTTIVGLFVFPQSALEHPFLRHIAERPDAPRYWFLSLALLAFLWIIVWFVEHRQKERVSRLLSLDYHREVLQELSLYTHKPLYMSRTELRDAILRGPAYRDSLPFFWRMLGMWIGTKRSRILFDKWYRAPRGRRVSRGDREVGDEATDLAIARYLEREWIRPASLPKDDYRYRSSMFDDWYEVLVYDEGT